MKNIIYLFVGSLLIFSCGSSKSNTKETATKQPVDVTVYGNSITSEELSEMLYTYASDEFEGRETGKPGQKKAIEYIKNHYVKMGIPSPLSGDDYFQEVPLEKIGVPNTELSINGKSFNNFDSHITLRTSEETNFNTNEIVYAGFGIDDENYSDYKSLDVKDKIVLIKAGEPKNENGTYITSGTSESTKWSGGRQSIASKRDAALNNGAKAVLFLDNESFSRYAPYYKSLFESGKTGRLSLSDNTKSITFLLINEDLAKAILPTINDDDTAKTVASNINITIESKSEHITSENVVAFIRGSEKPDEIIIISAHLDHIGISKEGIINNGADDDGSGTVAVIEIAEAFKEALNNGYGPKRSILFLHVTGEEKGLLGSRYYTDSDPIFPLENTVVDLNIDMIGRTDPKRQSENRNYIYLIGSDKLSTELHTISEEVNAKYCNIELDYKYNDDNDPNRFYYRSDHYNFAKNNIPVIFYFNGTHDDYHKPSDTPDKIQYDLLQNRARLVFYTAWELANREDRIVVDKVE